MRCWKFSYDGPIRNIYGLPWLGLSWKLQPIPVLTNVRPLLIVTNNSYGWKMLLCPFFWYTYWNVSWQLTNTRDHIISLLISIITHSYAFLWGFSQKCRLKMNATSSFPKNVGIVIFKTYPSVEILPKAPSAKQRKLKNFSARNCMTSHQKLIRKIWEVFKSVIVFFKLVTMYMLW